MIEWVGRVRRTGGLAPGKMGGDRPYILDPERDWLLARLEEKPDLTLHTLGVELIDCGVSMSTENNEPAAIAIKKSRMSNF